MSLSLNKLKIFQFCLLISVICKCVRSVNNYSFYFFATSFYNDFGPLNLAMLYRYCQKVNRKLKVMNDCIRIKILTVGTLIVRCIRQIAKQLECAMTS